MVQRSKDEGQSDAFICAIGLRKGGKSPIKKANNRLLVLSVLLITDRKVKDLF